MIETGMEYPKRHKFLTEEVRKKLSKLYALEDQDIDANTSVKFFLLTATRLGTQQNLMEKILSIA